MQYIRDIDAVLAWSLLSRGRQRWQLSLASSRLSWRPHRGDSTPDIDVHSWLLSVHFFPTSPIHHPQQGLR